MADLDTLDPEDVKLVTLARASRARTQAAQGAAVRDETGRTYSATNVTLDSMDLSALKGAVAAAISSGAKALEAAVVVGDLEAPDASDLAVVREFGGAGTPLHLAGPDAVVRVTVTA